MSRISRWGFALVVAVSFPGMDAVGAGDERAMAAMPGHMYMTTLRSPKPGDQQKADAIAAAARQAMAPYRDYHKALDDGYEIFLPNVPQPQYHFTNAANGLQARSHFDPLKPTSLLYKKTADGGYELLGAMYTDRVDASEDEINERIPLSVARWHQHINFCKAPAERRAEYFGAAAKIRIAWFDFNQGGLRIRGRYVLPPLIRLDGARLSGCK